MIDLHYWPTPNGWKISIMLEECALPYRMVPVNIGRGEQFKQEFLAISPNNRMPAVVDHDPPGGGAPVSVFESGAILVYLAEKSGKYLPTALRERKAVLEWLMWQMGGLGPMAGQNGHFLLYAPEKVPYAIERYGKEVDRLYGVLDAQLGRTGAFVAGSEYSIADMAIFPWTRTHKAQKVELARFPHVERWYNALFQRPAIRRALDLGRDLRPPKMDDEAKKVLFGQTAQTVRDTTPREEPAVIEFFFDISSPWTYLAFHNLQPLAAELGVPVRYRPIMVGGIFNSINPSVYQSREHPVPAKAAYMLKDLADWARIAGIAIRFPPTVFPVNSVKAMRACLVLEAEGKLVSFATAAFEAYWGQDQDISNDAVLTSLCERSGVDAAALLAAIARQEIKDRLKANTDEVIRRGGYGSPTLFVDGDDMYFGNDRLPLVRDAVLRRRKSQ